MIKYVDELEKEDLKGKRVLLRLDLNVAVNDGQIVDDFDIQRVIPTIDFLREKGSQIIIIAHIENSNGEATTLLPVFDSLKGYFPIEFCPTYFTPESVDKLLKMDNKSDNINTSDIYYSGNFLYKTPTELKSKCDYLFMHCLPARC